MQRRTVVIASLAAALIAGLAGGIAALAAAGEKSMRQPAAAAAGETSKATLAIAIAEGDVVAGPVSYTLTCAPAGGSLPHPARACAAIARHPSMLVPQPQGLLEPCAFGADVTFAVTGRSAGAGVDSMLQACASGQSAVVALWEGVVPSGAARLTTHVDRGVGLFALGETRAEVRLALGRGRTAHGRCSSSICTRVYPTGLETALTDNHTFTVSLIVGYRRGRIAWITTDNPQATIDGVEIDAGYRALRRRLADWRATACPGGVRLLGHGARPSTEIEFKPYYALVTVQDTALACP